MKRFIFRLERVFRLRAQVERQRAQALARAIHEEQERRDALDRAAERLEHLNRQVAGNQGQIATAGAMRNLGLTLEAASNQIDAARSSHHAARDAVASEQEQFGKARMERRVVERLRERRREAWSVEETRAEQREQDGLAARRPAVEDQP